MPSTNRQTNPKFNNNSSVMNRLSLFLFLLALGITATTAQDDLPSSSEILERFSGALEQNETLSAESKQQVLDAMRTARDNESEDAVILAEALRVLYPEFNQAQQETAEDDGRAGLRKLYKLARSKDRFLAAEAAYFMARTLYSQERHEEALPFLDRLRGDLQNHTLRHGDALYYLGAAQANSLQKEAAIENLSRFLEDYPDASDRLRFSAQATLDGIVGVNDGSMDDIADHMDFSHRRLSFEDSGEKTREVQDKVVAMLDSLIEQAEQQQQQQQQQSGGGSQQQQSGAQQQPGAGQGQTAGGNGEAVEDTDKVRKRRGGKKSAWDQVRERDRATDALSGLKSKYPPRYRELVEQYFSELQEGEDGGAEETTEPQP